MRIPAQATIAACEKALANLSGKDTGGLLEIPTNLKYLSAGGEASWVQFLITWAQLLPNHAVVKTYAKAANDTQIEKFSRRLYGLIAALTATKIVDVKNVFDLTEQYRSAALCRLNALQSNDPMAGTRGPSIEVVAADHLRRRSPAFLYRKDLDGRFELRPRDEFVRLARYLLRQIAPSERGFQDSNLPRILGNLLFEIFKNTEDHACSDLYGDQLSVSFRLFQGSRISPDKSALDSIASDFEPFGAFFSRQKPVEGKSQLPFFVLSILDSGPGFAQRWTGRPLDGLSLAEERKAVTDCFAGKTTKRHKHFGQGLPLVRALLKEWGGFLRIRTGRFSLYYDAYYDAAYDGNPDTSAIPLKSWCPDSRESLAPAVGTLLTIVLPLRGTGT